MARRVLVRATFGLFLLMSPQLAVAQVAGGTPLPAATISAFTANPGQLLTQFPSGGPGLIALVRDYLTSDKGTLTGLIGILANANQDQRLAVAKGLAEAAKAYAATDLQESTNIQQAVARTGLSDVILAYASVAGDTGTATTAGGGGGAGGGGPTTNFVNTTTTTPTTSGSPSGTSTVGLTTGGTPAGSTGSVSPQ